MIYDRRKMWQQGGRFIRICSLGFQAIIREGVALWRVTLWRLRCIWMWCMFLWQTHCFEDLSYKSHIARWILQWIMDEPSGMQHPAERNTTCNLAIPGWNFYFKIHSCVHAWRLRDFDQHWWCEKIHQEKCESWRWADAHLCSTDTNTLTQSCNADNVFVVAKKDPSVLQEWLSVQEDRRAENSVTRTSCRQRFPHKWRINEFSWKCRLEVPEKV